MSTQVLAHSCFLLVTRQAHDAPPIRSKCSCSSGRRRPARFMSMSRRDAHLIRRTMTNPVSSSQVDVFAGGKLEWRPEAMRIAITLGPPDPQRHRAGGGDQAAWRVRATEDLIACGFGDNCDRDARQSPRPRRHPAFHRRRGARSGGLRARQARSARRRGHGRLRRTTVRLVREGKADAIIGCPHSKRGEPRRHSSQRLAQRESSTSPARRARAPS